jgi:hypothetical protein
MPEMSDEEKAARLAFYKEQAQEQWGEHERRFVADMAPANRFLRWYHYVSLAIVLFIVLTCGLIYLVYIR